MAAAAASSWESPPEPLEAMMQLGGFLSPLDSDGSDTDLDVSADEQKAFQSTVSQRRRRFGTGVEDPPEKLTRSQTVYLDTCRDTHQTEQGRIISGLGLETLCLRDRYLGTNSFRPISLALRVNSEVCKLDFSFNGLDAEGMLRLANVLKVNTTVQELNLASNCIGDKGAIAVADLLKNNSIIHTLDLSSNQIGEDGGKFIALGIEDNASVRRLNLSRNRFSESGALYIGRALAENFVLEELDISWCRVRKVGAVGLCQGIRRNVSLSIVNLSWNGLGYEGALALSEMLKGNKYVRELDVRQCRINWQGAIFVAGGLKANSYLETLRIGGNPLSTTGCLDILEGLTGLDCAITLLDLRGNSVTNDFDFLAQTIGAGRQFRCIHDGVLPSHDLIGQRKEARRDPMAQIMLYMDRFKLRPLELLRSFDKSVMLQMGKSEFTARLRKAGMDLREDEVDEIIYQLKKGGEGRTKEEKLRGDINYKKISEGFRDQKRKERLMKIQEQNLQQKLQTYHKDILTEGEARKRVSDELGSVSLADIFFDRARTGVTAADQDGAFAQQPQPQQPAGLLPLLPLPRGQRQHKKSGGGGKKKPHRAGSKAGKKGKKSGKKKA